MKIPELEAARTVNILRAAGLCTSLVLMFWVHSSTQSSPNETQQVEGRSFSFPSLVSCREIFFDPLDELHADFCHIVPSQSVLSKSHIHSHLDLNQTQRHLRFYAQTEIVAQISAGDLSMILFYVNHQCINHSVYLKIVSWILSTYIISIDLWLHR